jgi:nucleotide-binding universal stress UspA family protein
MMDRILLAVDATDASKRAVQVGAEVAHGTGAEVAVLHARRHDVTRGSVRHVETVADARQLVDDVADKLVADGVKVSHRLVSSTLANPAADILGAAAEADASLIVLGTRGGVPVVQGLLGNVAYKVVAESSLPVLTIPSRRRPAGPRSETEVDDTRPERVVVVAEDSDAGRRTLAVAREVVQDLGAEAVVLHARVVQPSRGGSWSNETHGQAVRLVEAAAESLERDGIKVAERFVVTVQGDPADEFIKLAAASGASLIIVPNRHRPRFAEALVPSTAHRLMGRSDIPVMSIPD